MKKMNKFLLALIFVFVLVSISCKNKETKNENNEKTEVINNVKYEENDYPPMNLSKEEIKKLNTFFSNFSEVRLLSFSKSELEQTELIRFAVLHNQINNYSKFENAGDNLIKIKKEIIEQTSEKYFGYKITNHQSTDEIEFKNGYYTITDSSGEAYYFSQINNLYDLENGEFLAEVTIYVVGSGWTGDYQANPETWDKTDAPEVLSTVNAIITKNNDKYILLEYIETL